MNSFLVHLASIAVMAHMTFGCSWHHGMGAASACNHTNSLANCCVTSASDSHDESGHDDDHGGHEHGEHESSDQGGNQLPRTDSVFDHEDQNSDHNHICCSDDGCNVIKVVNYKFTSLDFLAQYLGGVADSAILQAASTGFAIDPFPDCSVSAPKVRAHLLLGVQLI